MSKEDYEVFKILRHERSRDGADRREVSADLFPKAQQKAAAAGMSLIQHSDVHYSLYSPTADGQKCRWNVYPGNCRLYHDRKYAKPPFLKLPDSWDIMDVVTAAISAFTQMDDFESEVEVKTESNDQARIAERAYFLWEAAGRPESDGQYFWHRAVEELNYE